MLMSSKNAQSERKHSIGKLFFFPAISAHFPEEHLPNYAKSIFPLMFCFSAQNLKRARKMPRAPKSDQMEDPGMRGIRGNVSRGGQTYRVSSAKVSNKRPLIV